METEENEKASEEPKPTMPTATEMKNTSLDANRKEFIKAQNSCFFPKNFIFLTDLIKRSEKN